MSKTWKSHKPLFVLFGLLALAVVPVVVFATRADKSEASDPRAVVKPEETIVTVAGKPPITRAAFDHKLHLRLRRDPKFARFHLDAPNFKRCVDAVHETRALRKLKSLSQPAMKSICRANYNRAAQKTEADMIEYLWFQDWVDVLGIKAQAAETLSDKSLEHFYDKKYFAGMPKADAFDVLRHDGLFEAIHPEVGQRSVKRAITKADYLRYIDGQRRAMARMDRDAHRKPAKYVAPSMQQARDNVAEELIYNDLSAQSQKKTTCHPAFIVKRMCSNSK